MTKEAREYQETWTTATKQWAKKCPGVDEVLEVFAQRYNGTVEKWIGDTPSRVLAWHDSSADYSISMLLELRPTPRLRVWGAAWRDDEERLRRHFLKLGEVEVPIPELLDDIPPLLERLVQSLMSLAPKIDQTETGITWQNGSQAVFGESKLQPTVILGH